MKPMKQTLRNIQRTFLFRQFLIFSASVILIALSFTYYFSDVIVHINLSHVDRLADILVEQLQNAQDRPFLSHRKDILFYAIDEKTGRFIFERENWRDENSAIWESHKSKLIYEMQKQKNGWIFYPHTQNPFGRSGSRVIRYRMIDEFGWIAITEMIPEKTTRDFMRVHNQYLVGTAIVILAICFVFIRFMTRQTYAKMKNEIARRLENSLVSSAVHNKIFPSAEDIKQETSSLPEIKPIAEKPIIKTIPTDQPAAKVSKPFSGENKKTVTREEFVEEDKKADVPDQPKSIVSHEPRKTREAQPPVEPEYDDLTLNVNEIKSPVLKKMIKELRDS